LTSNYEPITVMYKTLSKLQAPQSSTHLRFLSPQPDISLHGLVHRTVCLLISQLSLILTARTHGEIDRLSWPAWLV